MSHALAGGLAVNWRLMDDSANIQNGNAGNGGDLVKHTVYLATLRFLLTQQPWSQGLRLRECHAGRGIYVIPKEDARRPLLSCLYSNPTADVSILLHDAQRKILSSLDCWPGAAKELEWYAGSALINASTLANNHAALHKLDLYEQQPETRRILRAVLTDMDFPAQFCVTVLPAKDQNEEFDGEACIEQQIGEWQKQDVVLLDPFAMWRQPADQLKRDHYRAIVDGVVRHGDDAPSLILFWTWGRNFPVAEGDLNGTLKHVKNGYQELRARFHDAGFRFVRVKWRWQLQFAMWVVVPRAISLTCETILTCTAVGSPLTCCDSLAV